MKKKNLARTIEGKLSPSKILSRTSSQADMNLQRAISTYRQLEMQFNDFENLISDRDRDDELAVNLQMVDQIEESLSEVVMQFPGSPFFLDTQSQDESKFLDSSQ